MTDQKWNWPGSRWWSFDLHCHSMASFDYKDTTDPTPSAWVEAARDAGLDAVAVTDHNTAGGLDLLISAAKALRDAPVIFPGVEITASDGTHLLAVTREKSSGDHVKAFYPRQISKWPSKGNPPPSPVLAWRTCLIYIKVAKWYSSVLT